MAIKRWFGGRLARLGRRMAVLPVPTRLGWYFLGAGLMLYLAGSYYSEPTFVLIACLLFGLLAVNALAVWRNVSRLSFKRQLPPEAHAGENFDIALLVHNSGRTARYVLELDDAKPPQLYRDDFPTLVMAVSAGHVHRATYSASIGRRGRHRLRNCVVSSAFPFGLVRMSRQLAFRSEVLIYPRPARLAPEFERRLLASARSFGESSVAARGQEEVFGVREYLPGQNVARIHWISTARTGKPMILELDGRQDASFVLILDTAPVGDPSTLRQRLEAAINLFAGITLFVARQGVLFRFAYHGTRLHDSRRGRGDALYRAAMERLALAGFSDKPLSAWVSDACPGGNEVPVLVTLGPKEHAEAALGGLREPVIISAAEDDLRRLMRLAPGRPGSGEQT